MRNVVRAVMAMVLLAASAVAAEEIELVDTHVRSFDRFELDADVHDGVWAEAFGGYSEGPSGGFADNHQAVAGARLAYGWNMVEMGVRVPWLHNDPSGGSRHAGIGDVSFYGKVVPLQLEFANLGAGLLISAPTGDEDKGLGVGDLGVRPFVTSALQVRQFQLRAHVAYAAYSGGEHVDGVTYGGGLFVFANHYLGVRAEFAGEHLDRSGPSSPLMFEPGIDIHFVFPEVDAWLRPTGLVGISDSAPDWGMFASIVISRTPGWQTR